MQERRKEQCWGGDGSSILSPAERKRRESRCLAREKTNQVSLSQFHFIFILRLKFIFSFIFIRLLHIHKAHSHVHTRTDVIHSIHSSISLMTSIRWRDVVYDMSRNCLAFIGAHGGAWYNARLSHISNRDSIFECQIKVVSSGHFNCGITSIHSSTCHVLGRFFEFTSLYSLPFERIMMNFTKRGPY